MGDLSAHFSKREFRCRCPKHRDGTEPVPVHPALIECLEDIRGFAGIPLVIRSGYRCSEHNAAVGGKPNSAHLQGEAADIFVGCDADRFKLIEAIVMCQVHRFGIGPDFIHVDVSPDLHQDVAWTYPGGKS